jgi:co-chaperonin GroES (HSP10)
MKAIGRNIVIEKKKDDTIKKTDGGLMLTGKQRVDIRYKEAKVLHCGDQVKGIKEGQSIFYDKNAGHRLEVDKDVYYVIKDVDVVVIL